MSDPPPSPSSSWNFSGIAGNVVQFLRLPVLASSGLAVIDPEEQEQQATFPGDRAQEEDEA